MVSRFIGRPLRSLLLLSFLLFLLVVSIQGQNMEKRRPMGYRNLNPKFRANLMDMMMGDAPAAASCEGKKCDNDGDCCSGNVCVSSGVCVAHHGGGASQKGLGDDCDMGKSDDCGKGLCCTTQKRFRQKARDLCLPCLD